MAASPSLAVFVRTLGSGIPKPRRQRHLGNPLSMTTFHDHPRTHVSRETTTDRSAAAGLRGSGHTVNLLFSHRPPNVFGIRHAFFPDRESLPTMHTAIRAKGSIHHGAERHPRVVSLPDHDQSSTSVVQHPRPSRSQRAAHTQPAEASAKCAYPWRRKSQGHQPTPGSAVPLRLPCSVSHHHHPAHPTRPAYPSARYPVSPMPFWPITFTSANGNPAM